MITPAHIVTTLISTLGPIEPLPAYATMTQGQAPAAGRRRSSFRGRARSGRGSDTPDGRQRGQADASDKDS